MSGPCIPLWCALLSAFLAGTTVAHAVTGECAVLLHGLGRTSLSMKRIQWTLQSAGYTVVNVSYPSRAYSVEKLSEDYLPRILATKAVVDAEKVHFVTHSMGASFCGNTWLITR